MERQKHEEPYFSKAFEELATFLKDNKKDNPDNSKEECNQSYNFDKTELSRFSLPDYSVIQHNESNKARFSLMQDSITGKETSLERNTTALNSAGCDYDPLYIETAYNMNNAKRPPKASERNTPTPTQQEKADLQNE